MDMQLHVISVGIHPLESISSMLRNCIAVGKHQLQQYGICRNLLLFIKKKGGGIFLQFPNVKNVQAPH